MRRGFLPSTPREPRKTASRTTGAGSGPAAASKSPSEPESKPPQPIEPPAKIVPIPTARYREPPPLPTYPPGYRPCQVGASEVPKNVPAALQTLFIYYNDMLTALRAQYPCWPLSFSTPSPPIHKVAPIDGAGLGLVATRDIAAGEMILRERPFIVQPMCLILGESLSSEAIYGTLEGFVERMRAENRIGVYALRNSKQAGPFPTYTAQYAGIARDISRSNHSCNPNTHHAFDTATLTYSLHALQPIRAGEEITITYLGDTLKPRHERQQELQDLYHFTCTCKICRLTGPEREKSDVSRRVLREYSQQIAAHDARFAKWVLGGAELMPLNGLVPEQLKVKIAESDTFTLDEGSWTMMKNEEYCEPSLWEPVLARLVKGHTVLEHEEGMRHYATKAAELRMAYTGSDGGWRAVAEHPRQTDWWAKLGAKRKQ